VIPEDAGVENNSYPPITPCWHDPVTHHPKPSLRQPRVKLRERLGVDLLRRLTGVQTRPEARVGQLLGRDLQDGRGRGPPAVISALRENPTVPSGKIFVSGAVTTILTSGL
jgi:hypothetical protein